ncbi:DoxX family protein [Actinophytocola sp.]|uniref:DoxX family protein n=1 Tax=Actinophytocola sp. TaxID=1872138 RepID=UPI002D7FDCEA|nr:DoxX family protein [Actinophytocola sp.]HET9140590.1 DoxX family protein [Actinophytocola sp.]HEU5107038.1 DoxX family protein [Micromonosporaceae bacterium]
MTTDDDRPRHAGDFSDSGVYAPGSGYRSGSSGLFDESGYTSGDTTTVLTTPQPYDATTEELGQRPAARWHAGADLGLLVLRLVVGALLAGHGLQVLFGWFQGAGIGGTADALAAAGFTNTTMLAWATGLAELVGGTFLVLGLFTPFGAAAVLFVLTTMAWVRFDSGVFAGNIELEAVYGAAVFAILFAGPGRISLDRPTPWYRHAPAYGFLFLILAAGAATVTLIFLR